MIVQIYEIQTPEEAERCVELGVDHIGSVLVSEREWRQPLLRELMRLTRSTRSKNSLIPLFTGQELLYKAMDYYEPHFVHFCESLTDARGRMQNLQPVLEMQGRFKARFPDIGIMRSVPVPVQGKSRDFPALEIVRALEQSSDFFLIDTWLGQEPVEGYVGITGRLADPDLAGQVVQTSRIPVILAGGLAPENVYEALVRVKPAGADSCTRTNAADQTGQGIRFKKDFEKVARFVAEVRRAEIENKDEGRRRKDDRKKPGDYSGSPKTEFRIQETE